MDAAAYMYVFNHVVLPPQLPQSTDCSANHELALLKFFRDSLNRFHALSGDEDPPGVLAAASQMFTSSMKVIDTYGNVSETILCDVLQTLSTTGHVLLHVKAQNAGMMLSHLNGEVIIEAFELAPTNAAAMESTGRLRRVFPDLSTSLTATQFADVDFQNMLAKTIATLSHQAFPGMTPQAQKAGQKQAEIRDTVHPHAVTEMLMSVVQAIGKSVQSQCIQKNTRDEVLWKSCLSPWRRSPLWLLVRIGLQLLCTRLNSSKATGNQTYKKALIHFHAELLEHNLSNFTADQIHVMNAKLSRRLLKLQGTESNFDATALWYKKVKDVMISAKQHLQMRWDRCIEASRPSWNVNSLKSLDFAKDTTIVLPELDNFLACVAARQSEPETSVFDPTEIVQNFDPTQLPSIQSMDFSGVYGMHRLTAFHQWVEYSLQDWLSSRLSASSTCSKIWLLMEAYNRNASTSIGANPELHSSRILTVMELWVACDKSACCLTPLLAQYRPETPLTPLSSLVLPTRAQMVRLAQIEQYVKRRQHLAIYGRPSIFKSFGDQNSFGVLYYQNSPEHRALFQTIDQGAQLSRRRKTHEFQEKQASYEQLMAQADDLDCDVHMVVIDEFNGVEEERHAPWCKKHKLIKQAKAITIEIDEWPLPRGLDGHATVFELDVPQSFAVWRDCTLYVLHDVLRYDHVGGYPLSNKFTAAGYKNLQRYHKANRVGGQRFMAVSEDKPFIVSHYKAIRVGDSVLADVCKDNAMHYQYCDMAQGTFIRDFTSANAMFDNYKLTAASKTLQRFLMRTPSQPNGVPHNQVLASQSSCPVTLPLKEFRALGNLSYGQRIQWLNLLRELAAPTIDFSKADTRVLILQVINQAGGPHGDAIERESHALLANEHFCLTVVRLLEERGRSVEENWESADALASFIHIAIRVCHLSTSESVRYACLEFLKQARSVALRWLQELQQKVLISIADEDRMQFTLAAVETALICMSTFDAEQSLLEDTLSQDKHLSTYLQCSMTIEENRAALSQSHHPLGAVMLHRWEALSFRAWPIIRTRIVSHGNRGLDLAIKSSWPEYRREDEWIVHEQCKHWLMTSTATQTGRDALKVHFDLLKGQLLVNGTPLARLPADFETHDTYRMLFGASQIQVRPSAMRGMHFAAKQEFAGYTVDFGMQGIGASSDLFVNCSRNGLNFEFVPARHFATVLPSAFGEDYVHWYSNALQIVECRPRADPWNSTPICYLAKSGRQWSLEKSGSLLVNPSSRTARALCDILSALEKPSSIHILYQTSESSLRIELPRLRLSFSLQRNSSELVSEDFRGMRVDACQVVGTLIGLENKIILENISGYGHKRLLVPNGQVIYQRKDQHVRVRVDDSVRDMVHEYQIDATLGRLVDKGTLEGKLFLSYLHALTAGCCVDPLTGKTGTEQALSILDSAGLRSFDQLTEDNMLLISQISGISPQRHFYPQHLRAMQTVKRDPHLSPLAQHSHFYTATQSILQQWALQKMFYPDSNVDIPRTSSSSHLIARDLVRSATFRVCSYGAEEYAKKRDCDYARRPDSHKAAGRAFNLATYVLAGSQTLPSAFASGLAQRHWVKFEDGDAMPGALQPFTPTHFAVSNSWLNQARTHLRSVWLRTHQSFLQTSTKADKFTMSMFLSSITFAYEPLTEAVLMLAALYNGSGTPSVVIPSADTFYPKVGTIFNKSNVTIIVDQAKRSIQTCASMWSRRSNEPDKQFRQRRKREFDNRQTTAAKLFTKHLQQEWPTLNPTVPDNQDVRQLIDTAAVIRKLTPLLQKWHDNKKLRLYLDDLETQFGQWPVHAMPAYQNPRREILTPIAGLRAFVSREELFRTNAPQIQAVLDESRKLVTVETTAPHVTGRLQSLLSRLGKNTEALYAKEYVDNLTASMTALQSRREERVSEYDLNQMDRVLLDLMTICVQRVRSGFADMVNAATMTVDETSSLACLIGQGPRATPEYFLQQLTSARYSQLPSAWKKCIVAYACSLVELQRLRRLVTVHRSHADFSEEFTNIPHQGWDPSEHPQYLLLEVESGIVIRSVQEEIAREMKTTAPQNTVMQLNMGEGKSSVIVPMVVSELANGAQLVRIVVPKPQARQLFQMLISKLGGLLGKRIYHLPVSRSLKLNAVEAKQVNTLCRECMVNGGVLLVQPEHMLSLKLMALDFLASDKAIAGANVLNVLHLFDSKARDIVDESDENFSVKFELVYTMGLQNPIDFSPDRWRIILVALQMLPRCAFAAKKEFPAGIEIDDDIQARFPRLRFLQADASARTMDLLATEICEVGLHGLPISGMTSTARRLIREYIREVAPSQRAIDFVDNGELRSNYDEVVRQTILLLRGLIANGVLNFAFGSKRWRVNYGPDPSRRPETKLAVPYRAKDCPSARSEFSHPDVVITLTSIHYYYAGLADSELFLCLEHVLRSDQAPAEYAAWTRTSPTLPMAFRELIGVNIKDRQQCSDLMFPHLRHATGVVNYYLQHIVFPKEMREFQHKMSASGWDIAERKTLGTTGFSGTNDSRYVLPLSVGQLDLLTQQHTNALVLSYLLQPESQVQLLEQKPAGSSDAEHLLRCIINGDRRIRVVLDVGAQILELDNLQVARLWLSLTLDIEGTKGAIFVDDKDEICVIDRKGHIEALQSSPFAGQMDLCLVYLDEAHTRGIDLRLPRDYRAAVTLGASLTKDRLVQACMRLRKLGKGQSVTFCVSEEIHTKVLALKAGNETSITVEDVLLWSMSETFAELKRNIPLWAVQGLRYVQHHALWSKARQQDKFQFSAKDVSNFMEPESQTLEQRYQVATSSRTQFSRYLDRVAENEMTKQIRERCAAYDAQNFDNATLLEEQERELAPEIEEERQIERPPQVKAFQHELHPDVSHLVGTGSLVASSKAFRPAFTTLGASSASLHYKAAKISGNVLVTKDFAKTVEAKGTADSFFRMPQWVISVPDSTRSAISHLVVISPFEAQELLPEIEKRKMVTLHVYQPRMHLGHQPLDKLDLFTIGRTVAPGSIPFGLILQLNMFSGQSYLNSFEEYEAACKFLGLRSRPASDDEAPQLDGSQESRQQGPHATNTNGAKGKESLIEFIKVLFTKVRRDCEGIDKTHLGKMLYGALLTEEDFRSDDVES